MEIAAALSLTSFRLARFQSPKLQAIAVPQQQAQSSQPIHFKVHIRNAEGEHVMTTIDGEVVDGGEPTKSGKTDPACSMVGGVTSARSA